MMGARSCGILCPVFSLPSVFGIGDIGPEAYRFVDFLSRSGQQWWQMLPLNSTEPGLGNSPYSSCSAFAFNTLFISPELLVEEGFLDNDALGSGRGALGPTGPVEYEQAASFKSALLAQSYRRYCTRATGLVDFDEFCSLQGYWLRDYALFMVLKAYFQNAIWGDWPVEFRDRDSEALQRFSLEYADEIRKEKFGQYLFYRQWRSLQEYCSGKGVRLIGDIPIYVNYDSADVWAHPEFFKLDKDKRLVFVAGVPPDYFSAEGQRWGNPVYDWDKIRATGFAWWKDRLRHNFGLFDTVRLDHFRGFTQCWEIPVAEKTAVKGAWTDVPGEDLFSALRSEFPELRVIAEDLGIITDEVDALKEKFGFPGMKVLLFAFHNEYKKSRDLPENYVPFSVAYTGTHDNNTVRGWCEHDVTPLEKKNMMEYFGREIKADEVSWIMIKLTVESVSDLTILSLPDLLGYGQEGRINRPSTVKGNWLWRYRLDELDETLSSKLLRLTKKAGRLRGME